MVVETRARTIAELKASGYLFTPVRQEMRRNLMALLRKRKPVFPDIIGYDTTVIPEIENALLAGQDIIFLGERGQAKSRIMRSLVDLLDKEVPVIKGCQINDDPLRPLCRECRNKLTRDGDATEIAWLPREERYGEKLATPDTTIADLIGDVDPIKVAEGRYLSDELTMHYGLIPRSNRGVFAINELPDLAERLQVGLFNLLEERDIQIRGYRIRLPLDVFLVASANPEDYTSRGRIITPLKDRFGAQVRTHYPATLDQEVSIVEKELKRFGGDEFDTQVPAFMAQIVTQVTQLARKSPDINQSSGVSVRVSIANYETMIGNAVRRAVTLNEKLAVPRISDLPAIHSSTGGKIEMESFEEAKEGKIIEEFVKKAVFDVFNRYYNADTLDNLVTPFNEGLAFEASDMMEARSYAGLLKKVPGLEDLVRVIDDSERPEMIASAIEFILEGLHVNSKLTKTNVDGKVVYKH